MKDLGQVFVAWTVKSIALVQKRGSDIPAHVPKMI